MRTNIFRLLIRVGNMSGSTEELTDPGISGFQIQPGTESSTSLGADISIIILKAPVGFGLVVILLMVKSFPKTFSSSSKVQGPAAMPCTIQSWSTSHMMSPCSRTTSEFLTRVGSLPRPTHPMSAPSFKTEQALNIRVSMAAPLLLAASTSLP